MDYCDSVIANNFVPGNLEFHLFEVNWRVCRGISYAKSLSQDSELTARLPEKKNVHNSLRGEKNAASMFEAKLYLIYIFLKVHYLNIDQGLSCQHNEIYKDTTNVTCLNCLFIIGEFIWPLFNPMKLSQIWHWLFWLLI